MNLSRKQFIMLGVAVVLGVTAYLVLSIFRSHKSPTYQQVTVNKDTGQTIISDPNQTPEKHNGSGYVTILGADKLVAAGMTQAQFLLAEQLITTYVNQQLHGKYQQVAILNQGFTSTGTAVTARLRLGTTQKLLNLHIAYHDLVVVQVAVSDPAGDTSYTYDSGSQTAMPPPTYGNDNNVAP